MEPTCQVWCPPGTAICPSVLAPQQLTFRSLATAELMLHVCCPPATTACMLCQQGKCDSESKAVNAHCSLPPIRYDQRANSALMSGHIDCCHPPIRPSIAGTPHHLPQQTMPSVMLWYACTRLAMPQLCWYPASHDGAVGANTTDPITRRLESKHAALLAFDIRRPA